MHIHLGKPKKKIGELDQYGLLINIYSFLKKIIKLYSPKSSSTESNTIALNKPNPVVSLLDSIDRRHTMKIFSNVNARSNSNNR